MWPRLLLCPSVGARQSQATESHATLSQATESHATLSQATESQATLSQATESHATLSHSKLSHATLSQTTLSQVSVLHAMPPRSGTFQRSGVCESNGNSERAKAFAGRNARCCGISVSVTTLMI